MKFDIVTFLVKVQPEQSVTGSSAAKSFSVPNGENAVEYAKRQPVDLLVLVQQPRFYDITAQITRLLSWTDSFHLPPPSQPAHIAEIAACFIFCSSKTEQNDQRKQSINEVILWPKIKFGLY